MKKRHEIWLQLTGPASPVQPKTTNSMIRMRDLPGFSRMEDKLLLNPIRQGKVSPELEHFADILSKQTFEITHDDTLFDQPRGYDDLPLLSEQRRKIEWLWDAHEDQFETEETTDDEAVSILLRLGIDFRDQRGQPMRCVKLFTRQAEAAAKGIAGKLPDLKAVGLQSWANALEREAKEHMSRKRVR